MLILALNTFVFDTPEERDKFITLYEKYGNANGSRRACGSERWKALQTHGMGFGFHVKKETDGVMDSGCRGDWETPAAQGNPG